MSPVLFLLLILISLGISVLGITKSRQGRAFELVWWLFPWGAFVWGDAVIFGFFWAVVLAIGWWSQDLILLGVITALFWFVRSVGETIYWFNEQFATDHRNLPENLPGYSLFKNDSIWFVYQICWQCVTVAALFFSVWLFSLWLKR